MKIARISLEAKLFWKSDEWELAAKYQIGATALKARYGSLDVQNELTAFDDEGDQWAVEVEQKPG